MIEFAEPRIIRPATETDLAGLQILLPKGDTTVHATRYEAQKRGDSVYLLAVQNEVPVGLAYVTLNGAGTDAPTDTAPDATETNAEATAVAPKTADVQELFVGEAHRDRKVGSRLLQAAEAIAAKRGYTQIGIRQTEGDPASDALLDDNGYAPGEPVASAEPVPAPDTETGITETPTAPVIVYRTKSLVASNKSMENEENSTTTDTAIPAEVSGYDAPPQPTGRPVGEQLVDFTFGVALTAVEALENAVKVAQAEAPGVWTALQEKGRPAREKLVQSLRDETREETEAVARQAETAPDTDLENPDAPGDDFDNPGGGGSAPVPAPPVPIKPAPRPFGWGRSGNVSAEDEIRALEDRVKTLEREVVSPSAPTTYPDTANVSAPTPAETGTALVDFAPETQDADALTHSAYAITDDEERAAAPTQTGTFVATSETPDTPEAISAYVDGAEAPATASFGTNVRADANIGDTDTGEGLAPAKGKRSKKTTSEASAGTDTAPEVGEEPEA